MAGVTKKPISEETQKFEKITEKYRPIGINITDTTLSNESIEKSLIRGLFKYEIFEDCLNKSILYRKNENIPAWQKMLQMDELDDETTENTKNELLFQFNEKSVTNPGEMLHLFSFMILMSSIGEISKYLEEIKNECIAYINYLYNCEKLPPITIDFHEKTRLSSRYDSQGYWILDENKPIFSEICGHLFKMIDQKIIDNHTKNSEILLSSMINDPEFFIKSICHQPYEKGSIAELPVLKNIPTHIFLQTFLKVPRNQWYYISSALKRRYNVGTFNVYLQSEIDWAIDLVDHFEAEAKKLTGFKKYRLERVIPHEIKKEALAIKNRNLH